MIVGTLPPPRFTTRELRPGDVDFCYGSRDGQLWPILDRIFGLNLQYETTTEAIEQRVNFLMERKIAICDIVSSARRAKVDASDLGMQEIKLRNVVGYLQKYPKIDTILFTGGNSKNGPEFLFRKQLKTLGFALSVRSKEVPRIHELRLPATSRVIKTVSLTAPSGAANRAVGSLSAYKKLKQIDPTITTIDFRVQQYSPFF